jgi:hypothetical protein
MHFTDPRLEKLKLHTRFVQIQIASSRLTEYSVQVLLNFIQQEMGDKPHDVLRSAADEVLTLLKDDTLKVRDMLCNVCDE